MSTNTILATAPLVTTNYLLRATGTTIGNSLIWDNGTNVGIGNTNTSYTLDVSGTGRFTGALTGAAASFSGMITSTVGNNAKIFDSASATTGYQYFQMSNSVGTMVLGVDNNAGTGLAINSLANAVVLNNSANAPLILGTNNTARMTITSAGNVGIGTTTFGYVSSGRGYLAINGTTDSILEFQNNTSSSAYIYSHSAALEINANAVRNIQFNTNAIERMRITSGGGVGIGTTTVTGTTKLRVINSSAVNGDALFFSDNATYNAIGVYSAGADGYNGAASVIIAGRNTSTSRSINAGGTINASGTDYAEYMIKAVEDNIAKGDVVGVNENGLLTNIFTDAKSFVVKSTDPSYVGGDTWGNVDDIGKLPLDATDEQKAEHEAKIESARAKVDRIAFSGQVPCNVLGANVGDYIIPINDNGKIKGQAITNPSFEQYQISVGKVWKIMDDGRAWIAVKIG